jgi:hypothetical protein
MRVWAVILLCLVTRPVIAQSYSALELESWCKFIDTAPMRRDGTIAIPPGTNAGFCWGAFGMLAQLSLAVDNQGIRALEICAPPEVTTAQIIKIFTRYVQRHPEVAHLRFGPVAQHCVGGGLPPATESRNLITKTAIPMKNSIMHPRVS